MKKRIAVLITFIIILILIISLFILIGTNNPIKNYLRGELATVKQNMSITVRNATEPPPEPPSDGNGGGGGGGGGGEGNNRSLPGQETTNETINKTCEKSWECGNWSNCSNYLQYRNCTDINHCEYQYIKTETKVCTLEEQPRGPEILKKGYWWVILIILIALILLVIAFYKFRKSHQTKAKKYGAEAEKYEVEV